MSEITATSTFDLDSDSPPGIVHLYRNQFQTRAISDQRTPQKKTLHEVFNKTTANATIE